MKKNIGFRIVSLILCVALIFTNMDMTSFAVQYENTMESNIDDLRVEEYEEVDSKKDETNTSGNLVLEDEKERYEEENETELIQVDDQEIDMPEFDSEDIVGEQVPFDETEIPEETVESYLPSYAVATLPDVITKHETSSSTNQIVAEVEGIYYTATAANILDKLNKIRKDACDNGYRNPATGGKLTTADYKPLKWSSDLEAITRLRAVEGSMMVGHTRLNKEGCFTAVTTNKIQSYGENLAWNWSTGSKAVMDGINQWYDEKKDYLSGDYSSNTGHYKSIINPTFDYVAVSAFSVSSNLWTCVAQEFLSSSYYKKQINEGEYNVAGKATVPVEISKDYVKSLQMNDVKAVLTNTTGNFTVAASVEIPYYGTEKITGNLKILNADLYSSNPEIIQVESDGRYQTFARTGEASIRSKSYASFTHTIRVINAGDVLEITSPAKTTYYVGESINYTGGKVYNNMTGKTVSLSKTNVSGFNSQKPGICELTVKDGEYSKQFTVLIVDKLFWEDVDFGTKYGALMFPENPYGSYSWNIDGNTPVGKVGICECNATFTPKDNTYSEHTNIPAKLHVKRAVNSEGIELLTDEDLLNITYQGVKISPKVTLKADGVLLKENTDYKVTYGDASHNNVDVHSSGSIFVEGIGNYKGSIPKYFSIQKATLTVKANSYRVSATRTTLPTWKSTILGLVGEDEAVKKDNYPEAQVETISIGENGYTVGSYIIEPKNDYFSIVNENGEDVSANYILQGENGTLEIYNPDITYRVHYEMNGHGSEPDDTKFRYVKSGECIPKPQDPTADGFQFTGWYKDVTLTKLWDFSKDIVSAPTTLYAKWMKVDGEFSISDIVPQYFTDSAIKPKITVYDGERILKEKTDYTVRYADNTYINSAEYHPRVIITGKGNYAGEKTVEFTIEPMPLNEREDNHSLANGVSVTCKDVLTSSTKAIVPVTAVKYKKALKYGQDYIVRIKPSVAYESNGNSVENTEVYEKQIPAGMFGTFQIEVEGMGNYGGKYVKNVAVTDSKHQMSSATVTIASAYKKMKYSDGDAVIVPRKAITVKCGGEILTFGKEYVLSYSNNTCVGKATVTVTGKAPYYGSKSVTYTIEGNKFDAKSVTIEDLPKTVAYTGKTQILKNLQLVWKKGTEEERALSYGSDYVITYKNNINVGTMTVTYKACEESGFVGSFSKTVKIVAAGIDSEEIVDNQTSPIDNSNPVYFAKAGAKIEDRVKLINQITKKELELGKDYTITYVNNKAVGDSSSLKVPTATIKGKGNYTGSFIVPFAIVQKSLETGVGIVVTSKELQYSPTQKVSYVYKPSVTVKDDKSALGSKDIKIEYICCDQDSVTKYIEKISKGQSVEEEETPRVKISAAEDSGYKGSIIHKLHLYQEKLTTSNTYIVVEGNNKYTGSQLQPNVRVYKTIDSATLKLIQKKTDHVEIMKIAGNKVQQLSSKQYAVSYGANNAFGNKGTVTIAGKGIYSGSVTAKFSIEKRVIE